MQRNSVCTQERWWRRRQICCFQGSHYYARIFPSPPGNQMFTFFLNICSVFSSNNFALQNKSCKTLFNNSTKLRHFSLLTNGWWRRHFPTPFKRMSSAKVWSGLFIGFPTIISYIGFSYEWNTFMNFTRMLLRVAVTLMKTLVLFIFNPRCFNKINCPLFWSDIGYRL